MKNGKYDPEVTFTSVRSVDNSTKFKNGETIGSNVHTKLIKDRIGVNIKYLWTTPSTNDAFKTKLMLSLSANEPLPDFMNVSTELAQELIDSGRFQPVDELFEKYASPKWKAAMAQVPGAWFPYIRDGKKYGIPALGNMMQYDASMFIRKDWLDKLGLQPPKTLAELETVMDAFVNRDPDGDGKANTYALAVSLKSSMNSWMSASPIFGAFGAVPEIWEKDAGGQLVYGSVRPEIKPALAKLKEWIDKGYMHKEAGIQDEEAAGQLFSSGKAGIAFGPTWLYSYPLKDVEKLVNGAQIWPYPLPAGPDGKIGQKGGGDHQQVYLFNKDWKNPEIFMAYENFLYESYLNLPAGAEFQYGYNENYDYAIVDGKATYEEKDIPGGKVDPAKYFLTPPPRDPTLLVKTFAALADGKKPETPWEEKVLKSTTKQELEAARVVYSQRQHTLENLFTGKPTNTMKEKMANLKKMESEAFSKIIYGKTGLDGFEQFVKDWNAAGGEQITKEVRDWYKTVGGK